MARRKPRVHFYRRGFFNHPRHQSIALFLGQVDTEHGVIKSGQHAGRDWTDLGAFLTLGDCSRSVSLEFSTSSRSSGATIGNIQHKSDVLRKLVNDFCDKIDAGLDQVRQAKSEWTDADESERE